MDKNVKACLYRAAMFTLNSVCTAETLNARTVAPLVSSYASIACQPLVPVHKNLSAEQFIMMSSRDMMSNNLGDT